MSRQSLKTGCFYLWIFSLSSFPISVWPRIQWIQLVLLCFGNNSEKKGRCKKWEKKQFIEIEIITTILHREAKAFPSFFVSWSRMRIILKITPILWPKYYFCNNFIAYGIGIHDCSLSWYKVLEHWRCVCVCACCC